MLRLYMHQASSRLACRDIQRIQRIQRIQLYSYTRYTAYSTIQRPSGRCCTAAHGQGRACRPAVLVCGAKISTEAVMP